MEKILEEIRVAVIFGPGSRVSPVWFDWRRRKHTVKEVTYSWQERQGNATILHFAVTDGCDLFELAYNAENHIWNLRAVDGGSPYPATSELFEPVRIDSKLKRLNRLKSQHGLRPAGSGSRAEPFAE